MILATRLTHDCYVTVIHYINFPIVFVLLLIKILLNHLLFIFDMHVHARAHNYKGQGQVAAVHLLLSSIIISKCLICKKYYAITFTTPKIPWFNLFPFSNSNPTQGISICKQETLNPTTTMKICR